MIKVSSLSFSYDRSCPPVLEDISFNIEKGSLLAVLGNNGAGKSTLLKCLDRIHKADSGSVTADGEDIMKMPRRELARRIAYVPQTTPVTDTAVFDAVLLGRKPYIRWDITGEDRAVVSSLLDRLGLSDFAARRISELSGGERQKVALARALAQQPRYLLLDEPTSSLDPKNQHEMLRLVRSIAVEQDIGVLIVIHDLNLAVRYCDNFLFIRGSRVYSHGGVDTVTPEAIRDVYDFDAEIIRHNGQILIAAK